MANWANISRNAKAHGDFAGRTQAEQDAYFKFFAGSKPRDRKAIAARFRSIFTCLTKIRAALSFLRPTFDVASSETPSRN